MSVTGCSVRVSRGLRESAIPDIHREAPVRLPPPRLMSRLKLRPASGPQSSYCLRGAAQVLESYVGLDQTAMRQRSPI